MTRAQYARAADMRAPSIMGFLVFWSACFTLFSGTVAGITVLIN